jgi:putative aldouronate transport system substrate-binding protein
MTLTPPVVPFRQLAGWAYKGTDDEYRSRYTGTTLQGDGTTLDVFTDVLQRAAKLPKTDITAFAPLPPPPAERSADYTRTVNEGAFQFATGQRPIADWDAYVQATRAAGLDDWVVAATKRATEVGLLK